MCFQSDVRQFVQNKLDSLHAEGRPCPVGAAGGVGGGGDPILQDVKALVHVLQDCATIITPTYSVAHYFNKVGLDYFRVASLTMESKVLSGVLKYRQLWSEFTYRASCHDDKRALQKWSGHERKP